MKKIIALALVAMMLCVCTISASAAETTLPDVEFVGWWSNHTQGVEITEEGVELTFHAASPALTEWYHCPSVVIYGGDEGIVNGAGYTEYWVQRLDNWGWGYGTDTHVDNAATLAAAGVEYSSVFAEGFVWETTYVEALKAGVDVSVNASVADGKVTLVYSGAGITATIVLPVQTDKPLYLSLTGEKTTLTNIKVTTPDPDPVDPPVDTPVEPPVDTPVAPPSQTGDMIGVAVALLAMTSLGITVINKKK